MDRRAICVMCLAGVLGLTGCSDGASSSQQECDGLGFPLCVDSILYACVNGHVRELECAYGCESLDSCQMSPSGGQNGANGGNGGQNGGNGGQNDEEDPVTPLEPECDDDDDPYCESGRRVSCVGGLLKRERCGLDEECSEGVCIERICQAGERTCRNGQMAECQTDHSWELTPCETGTYCFEGECLERGTGPVIEACEQLTKTGSDDCDRKGSGSKLVLRGTVLGLNKTYAGGSVVVEGNHITYVGCDPDMSNATVITCPNAVITPGLINGHEHISFSNGRPGIWGEERYDHRHEWRQGKNGHHKIPSDQTSTNNGNSVVEIRSLMAATTSIFGSGSAPGLARNLDVKSQTVGGVTSVYQTFPLGDGKAGTMVDSGCKYTYDSTVTAFNAGCPYGPHIAEGINQAALNELRCLSGQQSGARDVFKRNVAVIHGIAATVDIIRLMATNNVKLIWSPRTNISLYGDTAMAPLYDRFGVTLGLGTDWLYSGSATMFRELACVDYLNRNHYGAYFSDYEIWKMATYNNAVAFGVERYIGNLANGMIADLAIIQQHVPNSYHRAVIEAESEDVSLVMVDGKLIYGDANLMNGQGEAINVCGKSRRFDLKTAKAKDGLTFAGDGKLADKGELSMNDAAAYPMFFCDEPEDEPTCVPQRTRAQDTTSKRTTYYTGDYTASDDADGDGIPNDEDNCPTMFNPVRPMDTNRQQSDVDDDGYGDICDPYPTCASNNDQCASSVHDDMDGDGVPDNEDNCPMTANPGQEDADKDGKGDACDACPQDSNPGENPCPGSQVADFETDFTCSNCKVPETSGYSTEYTEHFGDVTLYAVGNIQKYSSVNGITLTGNPALNTGIHVTGLSGLGKVTIEYIAYNPSGGKAILEVSSGEKVFTQECVYNSADLVPKSAEFEFNDRTLTGFDIVPQMGSGSAGNKINRVHITRVSWTLP